MDGNPQAENVCGETHFCCHPERTQIIFRPSFRWPLLPCFHAYTLSQTLRPTCHSEDLVLVRRISLFHFFKPAERFFASLRMTTCVDVVEQADQADSRMRRSRTSARD